MSEDGVAARAAMLSGIRRELLGPAACGFALDIPHSGEPVDALVPYVDSQTGEEVLTIEAPLTRYGLGVLFPKVRRLTADSFESGEPVQTESLAPAAPVSEVEPVSKDALKALSEISKRSGGTDEEDDATRPEGGFELADTTRRRASSMAVSFRVQVANETRLVVTLPSFEPQTPFPVNGRYEAFTVEGRTGLSETARKYAWWVRRQVSGSTTFELPTDVRSGERRRLVTMAEERTGASPLELEFSAIARRCPSREINDQSNSGSDLIVTVVLSNLSKTERTFGIDDLALFQTYFEVELKGNASSQFLPLPGRSACDEAAKSLDFIYRDAGTLAVGHGCSGGWRSGSIGTRIIATHFPTFEVPSMTPDLVKPDGSRLEVSMAELAGLVDHHDGLGNLEEILRAYEEWLARRATEAGKLEGDDGDTANRHLVDANDALRRMKSGLNLIKTDVSVRKAFRLMNHAMLLQQVASTNPERKFVASSRNVRGGFTIPFKAPSHQDVSGGRGRWRPFQIGFILAALVSTASPESDDRELVDLIWFPTGGGKTEAYLGLSAFSAFLRRIRNPDDAGTEVLMRYTLRLLTAQQFERASALICAMDVLRAGLSPELGTTPFSIGLWVGGDTTPNTWKDAVSALQAMKGEGAQNPFVISRCPWCGAQMGPTKAGPLGYLEEKHKVKLRCPDPSCAFCEELPVRVVDQDLYDRPPTIVIATVDKYAQLSWRPQPRVFFGVDISGSRFASPPNLIVQDEFHLITGPRGAMVGNLEWVVEFLGTREVEGQPPRRPKIVCSTATVRNYADQVRWLFARQRTALFPPPALSVDDSFFGVKARGADGDDAPGRQYVGIYAPALGSHISVQIRVYAAVLQSVMGLEPLNRDPYWTLLGFFNTLRDLGSTTTLLREQIQNHLLAMWRRHGVLGDAGKDMRRRISSVEELTGRLKKEEVSRALSVLKVPYGSSTRPVDVCLASNMIEVGIDVDRLGLMVITGQPKSNAQYIQVSGRVGRDWARRPGLVVVAYAPNRARDRSVFETFRSNHEKMYAAVEPASVTPFSLPALRRGLHAAMVAYVRQTRAKVDSPSEVDLDYLATFRSVLSERSKTVDPEAAHDLSRQFDARIQEWDVRKPMAWEDLANPSNQEVLQVPASNQPVPGDWRWRTPQTMRFVDAECLIDTEVVGKVWLVRQAERGDA